jgi:hypothetical protein
MNEIMAAIDDLSVTSSPSLPGIVNVLSIK